MVAPFAGAWIEIIFKVFMLIGLTVAPFAGAWIEILTQKEYVNTVIVAPFAGAWIEIFRLNFQAKNAESHPSRVRGLK